MDIQGIEQSIKTEVEKRLSEARSKIEREVRAEVASQINKGSVGATATATGKRRGRPPGSGKKQQGQQAEQPQQAAATGTVGATATRGRPAKDKVKCSDPECQNPAIARGLCSRHYQQARYHERQKAEQQPVAQ